MKDTIAANYQVQIKELQVQIDSLKNSEIINQLKYKAAEQHDVITSVNDFYDKSWNSLLWLIGILVGIFGLLLPIISQVISNWNQRKNLRDLTDAISTQLTEAFDLK